MPEEVYASGAFLHRVVEFIEIVSVAVEVLAIGIIVVAIVLGTLRYWRQSLSRPPDPGAYGQYKLRLARSLLLGLEILLAADVIRTVALNPNLAAIAALGVLVLIRTFLSWSLVVEMEGRWPWQPERERATPKAAGGER